MEKIKKHFKAKTHTDETGTGIFAELKLNFRFHPLCIRLLLCLVLSLFHLLTLSLSQAALPQFWTQEMPISLGEAESTQPDVCARGEEVFVVWSDNRIDGNYELFFRYSSDGGLTWSIEERITETEADSMQPAIVCGRSNVHLVWCEKGETSLSETATIFYSRWDGESWSVPQSLSSSPQNNPRRPDIAITQTGVVYVVWEEDSEDNRSRAYFTFSDDNMPFQKPELITVGDWNTAEPRIDGGYRNAYVVWRDEREATAQIYTKQLGETLFGYDTHLSSVGNCRRPSISVLEPQIYVAYESRSTEFFPADISVVESNDSGQSWKQAHQITSSTAESIRPIISAASGLVWLFWQDGESGNWRIHFSYKKDQIWSPSEKFRDNSGVGILPTIARSSAYQNPQFYLFWVSALSSVTQASHLDVSRIFYSRRDTIPPKTPGKPLHIDENAKVGYDNDTALTFSWTHEKKTDEEVAGYNIYVSIDREDFEKIDSTARTIYNLTGENEKSYQICVSAYDSVGNTSELSTPSEIVYVDNIPPRVQIHLPRSGSMLVRPVPIIASCYDENLVSCRLKYGETVAPTVWHDLGEQISTEIDREKILVWDWREQSSTTIQGVYTLNLSALDEAGNQSFSKIPVIVDNLPPLAISPGEMTKLPNLDLESAYRTPSFSFDGNLICFSSNEGGTEDIWAYSLSSRQRFRVTQDQDIDFSPTWSPDSNWIAFQSCSGLCASRGEKIQPQRDGAMSGWDIWIVRSDGSDRRPLIQSESNETTPAFSPSGKQMAFTSDLDGDEEIWILTNVMEVMESAEPQLFQLTHNDYPDTNPAWAPDETRLAFCANRFGNWDVFEIYIDGSGEKRLTDQFADETFPKYSPDGKRILYLSNSSGTYNSVVARVLTEERRASSATLPSPDFSQVMVDELVKLTMPGEDVLYADWAPDMQSIVYQAKDLIQFRKIDFPVEGQGQALPLQAVITRPYEGENLSGEFDIKGIAKGANFVKYNLEYSYAGKEFFPNQQSATPLGPTYKEGGNQQSDSWYPIGGYSTAQVEYEDFLGRLDTSNLQGEYVIRLTVTGENSVETDEVKVFVQSEHPNLSIEKPLDGTMSSAEMILVEGRSDRFATVTVNDTEIKLDEDGRFSTKVLLNEDVNKIQVKAINAIGLESYVERQVIRDTRKPEINLTSPSDFVLRRMPYVTVSGQVSETADIELICCLSETAESTLQSPYTLQIPLDDDRRFSHTISLNEGTNEIRLKAKDLAGFESEIVRRVIYEKFQNVHRDTNPPAITNVFPLNDITLGTNKVKVKALLIDDLAIDIDTLVFSFDDEQYVFDPEIEDYTEFDGEIFDFNPETGEFSYVPEFELADGEHNFTIDVMDEEENSADSVNITFFIDTRPISVALSASKDNNHLRISLASNKPLEKILEATVYPTTKEQLISEIGYSLNLNLTQEGADDKPLYTGIFYPIPTHKGFILSASILPTSEIYETQQSEIRNPSPLVGGTEGGSEIETIGFYTEGEFSGEQLFLSIPNGPSVSLLPLYLFAPLRPIDIVLRSQDGSDLDRVAAQLQDAKNRGLESTEVVYQLESSKELEIPIQLNLELPRSSETCLAQLANLDGTPHKAMFYWNEKLSNWEPLDAKLDAQTGYFSVILKHDPSIEKAEPQKGLLSNAFGAYALLVDEQPPVIERIFPEDGEDVPLDRFLVEIYFHDEGSGIASANLEVDGKQADFVLDQEENRLTYLPKDLEPGLHRLSVSVYDRASNSAHKSSTVFTQEIFAFADEPYCYPNPASQMATISFRLTQSADVISLEIYNVAGEQVYKKTQIDGQQSEFSWDCENQSGKQIASGVYVYLLKSKKGKKEIYHKGKIAVVK